MKVWVPESALGYLEELKGLPDWVEVEAFPEEGATGSEAEDVEFVVAHWDWSRNLLEKLSGLPNLRVVQTPSAGVEWILPYTPSGVTLCGSSGVHDPTVSEWIVGAILAVYRDFPRYLGLQREGIWEHGVSEDLEGKTVLIVGHGSIGRALESRLAPFGVNLLRVALHPREGVHGPDDLPALVSRADVVVVLLPLTPETRGLFGQELLGSMREGALLVNAARGKIVDTDALIEALSSGKIRAALDTTDPEPLPQEHPLWSAPGVFITPHTAGDTRKFPERVWRFVRDQISRYASGEPLVGVVHGDY